MYRIYVNNVYISELLYKYCLIILFVLIWFRENFCSTNNHHVRQFNRKGLTFYLSNFDKHIKLQTTIDFACLFYYNLDRQCGRCILILSHINTLLHVPSSVQNLVFK